MSYRLAPGLGWGASELLTCRSQVVASKRQAATLTGGFDSYEARKHEESNRTVAYYPLAEWAIGAPATHSVFVRAGWAYSRSI
jgi:hypothetical protein